MADAFVAPPAHDVHSPGGIPLKATFFESDQNVAWDPTRPSQSLADMKCRVPDRGTTCDASVGAGEITPWGGYNFEYVPSTRELVIHCYRAKAWLYAHQYLYGVAGTGRWALVAVSTTRMGSGTITILEEDHLEHLVGDQTDEYQLATATIS